MEYFILWLQLVVLRAGLNQMTGHGFAPIKSCGSNDTPLGRRGYRDYIANRDFEHRILILDNWSYCEITPCIIN